MKFKTQVSDFQSLLYKVMPAVSTKTHMEVFEHILLKLNGEELTAIAADYEINIKSAINVAGEEDGETLIPAKKVSELTKVMASSAEMIFDCPADSHEVKITSGKSKIVVKGIDAEEFADLPELFNEVAPDVENLTELQAFFQKAEMQRLAEKTYFAVSTDEFRLNMTGVLFQFRENYVNAVATDSFRLVRTTLFAGELQYPKDIDIVVPARVVEIMRRINNDLTLTLDGVGDNGKYSYLRIDFGNTVLVTRLIEATFPKYEAIIPVTYNAEASVDVTDLQKALKQVAPIVAEKTKKCKLSFSENGLIVSAENDDLGEIASCDLLAEYKTNSDDSDFEQGCVVSYNIKYLEDMLQNISANDTTDNLVVFYFVATDKAALLKPKAEQDLLTMILMPIRL